MNATTLREKVIARLVKGGFDVRSAERLTEGKDYDYAVKYYTTPKTVCDCILAFI